MLKIKELCVEYTKGDPVLDEKRPRFSWKLESDKIGVFQIAYRLRLSGGGTYFDTGVTESGQSVLNDILETDLLPRTEYLVELTVYDNQNEIAKTELAFETALLGTGFERAEFIVPEFSYTPTSSVVFKKINLKSKPEKARAYVSALGMYTLDINGNRAGDIFFAPYWTDYRHTLEYQTYDITGLLRKGENLIEITLAKGWYRTRLADYGSDLYGDVSAAIAEFHIDDKIIATDESWRSRKSIIIDSELYDGEIRDYTRDLSDVFPVKKIDWDKSRLTGQINEPCRITERLRPVSEFVTPRGERVIDFGQNLAGVTEIAVDGKRGQRIVIRHAEILDGDGNFYTKNLRTAKAEDVFILSGGKQTLRAEFTYHGFRYVQIIGEDVVIENAEALVIHSDMCKTGFMKTSNESVNRLVENIAWTQRSNFIDVPTDCPQRDERLGWTGDISTFIETAVLQFNTALFFKKWLKDMRNGQGGDGSVPIIIPAFKNLSGTSAIWADSVTLIPWSVYREYGDKRVLQEHFPAICKYLAKMRCVCGGNGIIEHGHQFGDWLAPDTDPFIDCKRGATDMYFIANAYYAESLKIAAVTAKILGERDLQSEFEAEHTKLIENIRKEYFTANGRMVSESQTACVLALHFGLVAEQNKGTVAETLKKCVAKRKGHLSTGFAATQYLLQTLVENGLNEEAERVFLIADCPGWLYEVKRGATTVWERWDAILPDGKLPDPAMNSFNHYAFASVGAFLFRKVAGIEIIEAGYKRFSVNPCPIRGVDYVKAEIETVYGTVKSCYEINGDIVTFSVTVPVNTSAVITLPDGTSREAESGEYSYELPALTVLKTDKFTLESKFSDILRDESAAAIARKIAPMIFSSEQAELLSMTSLTLGQLCNMSGENSANIIKKLLIKLNDRLGG